MTHFFGIPDEQFIRGNIPMTKQEIRTMVLAKARICPHDIVVDVGAGTGSLSIEAALQAEAGKVYAIEREQEGIELIRANAVKFGLSNLVAISGTAPAAMKAVPAKADVLLIGGSGGHLPEILAEGSAFLKQNGRMVITAVTIETLQQSLHFMRQAADFSCEAFGLQVTRIRQVGAGNMLQALNPIYIIACTKV
ncbi:MAG: precorrin-6Y C5,15-methyltransferase (decarboxylating) subunit CbiT [Veillonellales bacterium]